MLKKSTYIVLIVLALSSNVTSVGTFSEYVLSITPDSKKMLLFQRLPQEDLLILKDIQSNQIFFHKYLGGKLNEALCTSNIEVIVFYESKSVKLINTISNEEREIAALNGTNPKGTSIDYESGNIIFADLNESIYEPQNHQSNICIYNLKTEKLNRFSFNINTGWLFDIVLLQKDTLLLNHEGFLAKTDLVTKAIEYITDIHGKKIDIGESPINVNKSKTKLLFSIRESEISIFDMQSREVSKVNILKGYIYPLLSPDESFVIVENSISSKYQVVKLDKNFFK